MLLKYQPLSTAPHRNACTAPQVKIDAVQQCSSQCRGGNSTTTTHCNTDAVEYEQSLRGSIPYPLKILDTEKIDFS